MNLSLQKETKHTHTQKKTHKGDFLHDRFLQRRFRTQNKKKQRLKITRNLSQITRKEETKRKPTKQKKRDFIRSIFRVILIIVVEPHTARAFFDS